MTNLWNVMFDKKYDSFRQNLDYIWDDTQMLDKQTIFKLMRDRGFRRLGKKYDYARLDPSELQKKLAWNYLTEKYGKKEIDIIFFRTEKYKYFTAKRVMLKRGIIYKNKHYRKGQFLPKGYK